jgi:hypothetical protein
MVSGLGAGSAGRALGGMMVSIQHLHGSSPSGSPRMALAAGPLHISHVRMC